MMNNEENKLKAVFLKQRQSLPLECKITLSLSRIKQWLYLCDDSAYVSFSGGKDSTVLLDLVRSVNPSIPAVFVDTGLEFPEIRDFVKKTENVTWLTPPLNFKVVLDKYGYPVVSKAVALYLRQATTTKSKILYNVRVHGIKKDGSKLKMVGFIPEKWKYLLDAPFKISEKCCDIMKKLPFKKYEKETGRLPFIGTMASDSKVRRQQYIQHGCNVHNKYSAPLGFWLEQDIWDYIKFKNLPYSKIYCMGYSRTGCMFCMFGCHMEGSPNRFQRMKHTHPSQYKFCMENLGLARVLDFMKLERE